MNAFYLVGLAVVGIVLMRKKPVSTNTLITMDPIEVKPLSYSPTVKPVSSVQPNQGYINPGIPSGTGTIKGWQFDSNVKLITLLNGLNEYTE